MLNVPSLNVEDVHLVPLVTQALWEGIQLPGVPTVTFNWAHQWVKEIIKMFFLKKPIVGKSVFVLDFSIKH